MNKEIYGIDFDLNDFKHKYILTPRQKYSLELNLRQHLSSLLYISNSDEATIPSHESNTTLSTHEAYSQSSIPCNDHGIDCPDYDNQE